MASSLVDTWAYIAFILVVLIFMFLFALIRGCGGSTEPVNMNTYTHNSSSNYLLLYFLKSPVSVTSNPEILNMADLIIEYSNTGDSNLENILNSRSQNFFNQNFQIFSGEKDAIVMYEWGNFINSFWELKIENPSNGFSKRFKYDWELEELVNLQDYKKDLPDLSISYSFGIKRYIERVDLDDKILTIIYLPTDSGQPIKVELKLSALPNVQINTDIEI